MFKKHRKHAPATYLYYFTKVRGRTTNDVNTLYNIDEKVLYRAYITEAGQESDTYCFHNYVDENKTPHVIGHTNTKNAHHYRVASFTFDEADIWKRFEQLDITLRMTQVWDGRTMFRIMQDGEMIASARMRRNKDGDITLKIESGERNVQLLFFIFFAIARIY